MTEFIIHLTGDTDAAMLGNVSYWVTRANASLVLVDSDAAREASVCLANVRRVMGQQIPRVGISDESPTVLDYQRSIRAATVGAAYFGRADDGTEVPLPDHVSRILAAAIAHGEIAASVPAASSPLPEIVSNGPVVDSDGPGDGSGGSGGAKVPRRPTGPDNGPPRSAVPPGVRVRTI